MNQPNYLEAVKQQYEDYPYPLRNPQDERRRLIAPILECLDRLNYYGFGGKRNFHKNFRALVAGGGTGDAVILLAEQLKGTEAEIVYLDISAASMQVAQERAKVRGLENITWLQASILDIPRLEIGQFDYINCSGVLHHLKDPDAGLATLKSVLKEDGVMGLMVYGRHGRAGVYQMQELMRLISGEEPIERRIKDCRALLQHLPKTNWYQHNAQLFDDLNFGDIGLYDLFLHSQDRAYTIPELYDYVERQGLTLTRLMENHLCDPACYVADPTLLAKINGKDEKTRYAIGELLSGRAAKHTFYVSRKKRDIPSAYDVNMVPCLPIEKDPVTYQRLYEAAATLQGSMVFHLANTKLTMPRSEALITCFKYMDGRRTLEEIYRLGFAEGRFTPDELKQAFLACYSQLEGSEFMLLRHHSVPPYLTLKELEDRLKVAA